MRFVFEKERIWMAQLFSPRANVYSRVLIAGVFILICGAGWAMSAIFWSPWTTYVNVPLDQPVPFSHKHHVADDGIDCRYCHTSVEKSSFAGMPTSETCMSCHSQIFPDAAVLAPVRQSFAANTPLKWNRVYDLPDYVWFDHSIHVAKGIGCATCHGRVDQMPVTWRATTLYMKWCLDCHREPEKFVRPRDKVFDMTWQPPRDQRAEGAKLIAAHKIDISGRLMNCGTCHQ
jgi:Cytochrome c7 and related cytochrome c